MFGETNKTITAIYINTTRNRYGRIELGTPTTVSIKAWFETIYKEHRNAQGDTFITDAKAFLSYDSRLTEETIITIDDINWKIEIITLLEDFSGNKRTEIQLKKIKIEYTAGEPEDPPLPPEDPPLPPEDPPQPPEDPPQPPEDPPYDPGSPLPPV